MLVPIWNTLIISRPGAVQRDYKMGEYHLDTMVVWLLASNFQRVWRVCNMVQSTEAWSANRHHLLAVLEYCSHPTVVPMCL